MKKLLFLFTLSIAGLTTWAQPTIVDPGTQVTTEVCHGQYEVVLEDVILYEPNIQSNFNYANFSNFDFAQGVYNFPHQDTLYIDIEYVGPQASSGNISTNISFTSSTGTSDTITGITVLVNVLPTVVFYDNNPGFFCLSDSPIDLAPHAVPAGGTFKINNAGIPGSSGIVSSNGIFDPSLIPPNMPNTPVEYTYTDPGTGCYNSDNYEWYNYQNATPNVSVVPTNATSCSANDGQISVTPNGNTPNYVMSLPNGDTITSTNLVAANFTNLSPGSYYISISDDSGCVNNAFTHIESGDLSISGTVTDVSCPGASDGSIDITVNASGNYTLYWEHGAFYEDYNNAPAGTYTVYVTDDNGCQVSKSFTINSPTLIFNDPLFYVYDYDCYYPGMYPGEIYATAIGDGPLTYSMPAGGTMVNDSTYTDYEPGDYTVTVTDANGCTIDTTVTIGSYNYNEAYLNSVTPSDCGMSNGSIDINLYTSEPDSILNASWSNGATTEDLTNISPGTYTYTINQSNPVCNFTLDVVVNANKPLQNDICLVTVDSITTTNVVVWEREQTTGIDHYNIYRKSNNSGQFQKIDDVLASEESMFNDVWASPLVKSWEYRISAVNTCGVEGPLSNIHKTIHMTKTDIGNGDFKVEWNKYQGFPYAVHDIYRFTASTGWQLVQSVPNNQTSFTDTPPNTNGLDYSIEVDPGYVCESTKATSHNASRSNRSSGVFNPGEGTGASNNSIVENESFEVKMYPNPSNTIATLQFDANQKYNVTIYNMNGQVIETVQFTGDRLDINTSALSNGLYIVDIQNNKNKFTEKLVVQH